MGKTNKASMIKVWSVVSAKRWVREYRLGRRKDMVRRTCVRRMKVFERTV